MNSFVELFEFKQKINFTRDHLRHVLNQNDTTFETIKRFNNKLDTNGTKFNEVKQKLAELKAKIQRAKEAVDGVSIFLQLR